VDRDGKIVTLQIFPIEEQLKKGGEEAREGGGKR
jgi:hypothetical protein